MLSRIFVMTPIPAFLSLFMEKLREVNIEACGCITDYANKPINEIIDEIRQVAPDWVCIDPFVFQDWKLVNCTHLIGQIKRHLPNVKILAFAYHWNETVPAKCRRQGVDAFLGHEELTVTRILEALESRSSTKLVLTHLELILHLRTMQIIGSVEADSGDNPQATIEVPQSALMKLICYLALERLLDRHRWLVRSNRMDDDYSLVQGAVWDGLEEIFPSHQRFTEEQEEDKIRDYIFELIDKPRKRGDPTLPKNQLSVDVNRINDMVCSQLREYDCDRLIKGPGHGPKKRTKEPSCYELNVSIHPQNVVLGLPDQSL